MLINSLIDILLISVFINFIINVSYKYLSDQKEIKRLKDETKELNKKMKETKDKTERSEIMSKIMSENNKIMKMNMKPMMVSLLVVFFILGWLFSSYKTAVIMSPFALPFIGANLGWFWWYFISSIPIIIIMRKVMGINV